MLVELSKRLEITKFSIGAEKAPLLVIDNLVDNAEALVEHALAQNFQQHPGFFPGIRAAAPDAYAEAVILGLYRAIVEQFQLPEGRCELSLCHYSIVTTPPDQLKLVQRIPHFDSVDRHGLASVHYLFKSRFGGTAFYRHRKTGYEYINASRRDAYFRSLEGENGGPDMPGPGYIHGSTRLFEQIHAQDAMFNRMIIYRRNSLHSGCIDENFIPDPSPLTGRLSINSFIDIL